MNLHLTGHHLEITPAIRDYATENLDKIKRHFDNVVIDVNVILSVEKLKQKAEATMHVSGKNLFAECEDENLYVSDRFAGRQAGSSGAEAQGQTVLTPP